MEKKKTLEDHITNLAQAMNKGFAELHRRMDLNDEDKKGIRQLIAKGLKTMEIRFDGLEDRFDGLEGRFDGLEGKFTTLEDKVEKMDARNEIRFQNLETKLTSVSLRQFDLNYKLEAVHDDVVATKLGVKDLHDRLDGLATTVDHHDSAIAKLQKAVGQK